MEQRLTRFMGKTSWWFWLIVIFYNLLPPLLLLWDDYPSWGTPGWIGLLFYYAFNLVWLPPLLCNHIDLYPSFFIFFYGFGKEIIPIRSIRSIERCKTAIASTANSLDRVHIVTDKRDFYVSLKENDRFIREVIALQSV